ncbi:MAG: hypothetical protein RL098_1497 [Bacteroidota bacterium]
MKYRIYFVLLFLAVIALGIYWTILPNKVAAVDPYKALIQDTTNQQLNQAGSSLQNQMPTLRIKGGTQEQVQIKAVAIKTYLENGFARTRYDITFFNQFDRLLEAEFEFPLGRGQTITHFELEMNGELRPAVAVEKHQARVAYEATVRKGIDPGLLEKVAGNLFQMRVYPLLPNRTKRLRFEVCSVLPQDAQKAYFHMPIELTEKVARFNFQAIAYANGRPVLLKSIKKRNKSVNEHIRLTQKLPKVPAIYGDKQGGFYYVNTNMSLPCKFARKKAPKVVTVCWDVSASRSTAQLDKERELLEAYFKWIKNGKLELVFFAHEILARHRLVIQNGRVNTLRTLLKAQHYDGASSLSCLNFGRFKGDEILFFSDGIQTLGDPLKKVGKAPIYPIVSSQVTDQGLLSFLAKQSNGSVIDLSAQQVPAALKRLKRQYLQFLGFKESHPQLEYYTTQLDPASQRLLLSVKVPLALKSLTAQFGLDSKMVLHAQEVKLDSLHLDPNGTSQRKRWAMAKLESLEEQPKVKRKEICALGLKYNLVSSASSLLVLDSLSDYLEFRIVPPASLRKAYFKALHKLEKTELLVQKNHLARIKKEWKAYQKWYWNKPKRVEQKEAANFAIQAPMINGDVQEETVPSTQQEAASVTENDAVQLSLSTTGGATYNWSPSSSASRQDANGWATTIAGTYSTVVSANATTTISGQAAAAPSTTISVAAWNPKVPYLKSLRAVSLTQAYDRYLLLCEKYSDQPSFYIDICDFFVQKKQPKLAVRVLTNLAEMQLKDAALLRILAQKLLQLKAEKLALSLFKSIIELRPEEPQSYRDYGLALAQIGKYQEAIEALYKVVKEPYDGRFEGIHLIALNEINHLIARYPREIDTKGIPDHFLVQLPMDIRVVLNWDADNTDVDLWVTEPNDEKCMYSYKLTSNGGRISNDFTQGYGPEEYLIRKAPKGTYRIQAHYYGNHRPTLSGKAILTVQLFKNYGTPYEVKSEFTRRLQVVDEELDLATFEIN